jgi:hypothetical protein
MAIGSENRSSAIRRATVAGLQLSPMDMVADIDVLSLAGTPAGDAVGVVAGERLEGVLDDVVAHDPTVTVTTRRCLARMFTPIQTLSVPFNRAASR